MKPWRGVGRVFTMAPISGKIQTFLSLTGGTGRDMMTPRSFPSGFLWGTATSSHQVEGQNTNNQWWGWEQQPGRIWHGDTSGNACGWWRDAEPDLDRAAALGQNAHRMSIEWSRI